MNSSIRSRAFDLIEEHPNTYPPSITFANSSWKRSLFVDVDNPILARWLVMMIVLGSSNPRQAVSLSS